MAIRAATGERGISGSTKQRLNSERKRPSDEAGRRGNGSRDHSIITICGVAAVSPSRHLGSIKKGTHAGPC